MGIFKKTMSILVMVFFVLSLTAASASACDGKGKCDCKDKFDWKDKCDWKGKCNFDWFGFKFFGFFNFFSFFGSGCNWFGWC